MIDWNYSYCTFSWLLLTQKRRNTLVQSKEIKDELVQLRFVPIHTLLDSLQKLWPEDLLVVVHVEQHEQSLYPVITLKGNYPPRVRGDWKSEGNPLSEYIHHRFDSALAPRNERGDQSTTLNTIFSVFKSDSFTIPHEEAEWPTWHIGVRFRRRTSSTHGLLSYSAMDVYE